jgi:hypothetical protein
MLLPQLGEHRLEKREVHAVHVCASNRREEHFPRASVWRLGLAVLPIKVIVEAPEDAVSSTPKWLAISRMSIGTRIFELRSSAVALKSMRWRS